MAVRAHLRSYFQLKLIDFGNISATHPVYDLVYYFYMNTDKEFRTKHLENLVKGYFDIFGSYLPDDDGLTYDVFKAEFDKRREGPQLVGMIVS